LFGFGEDIGDGECLIPSQINIEGIGDGNLTICKSYCKVDMDGWKGSYKIFINEKGVIEFAKWTKIYHIDKNMIRLYYYKDDISGKILFSTEKDGWTDDISLFEIIDKTTSPSFLLSVAERNLGLSEDEKGSEWGWIRVDIKEKPVETKIQEALNTLVNGRYLGELLFDGEKYPIELRGGYPGMCIYYGRLDRGKIIDENDPNFFACSAGGDNFYYFQEDKNSGNVVQLDENAMNTVLLREEESVLKDFYIKYFEFKPELIKAFNTYLSTLEIEVSGKKYPVQFFKKPYSEYNYFLGVIFNGKKYAIDTSSSIEISVFKFGIDKGDGFEFFEGSSEYYDSVPAAELNMVNDALVVKQFLEEQCNY